MILERKTGNDRLRSGSALPNDEHAQWREDFGCHRPSDSNMIRYGGNGVSFLGAARLRFANKGSWLICRIEGRGSAMRRTPGTEESSFRSTRCLL